VGWRALLGLASTVLLSASCERPGDRLPAGYADACYGGLRDMARNLVLSDNRMTITVRGQEKDWPLLARIVKEAGAKARLQVFDVSTSIPNYIRSLEVSACEASGLYVRIDKRLYVDSRHNFDGDRITTVLATYKKDADWRPVATSLAAAFETQWPGEIEVHYPPLIPVSQRALPDSIRAELEREGTLARQH
jgi:hypothetical protein